PSCPAIVGKTSVSNAAGRPDVPLPGRRRAVERPVTGAATGDSGRAVRRRRPCHRVAGTTGGEKLRQREKAGIYTVKSTGTEAERQCKNNAGALQTSGAYHRGGCGNLLEFFVDILMAFLYFSSVLPSGSGCNAGRRTA